MRTRKVELNLPLMSDQAYRDISVEFSQVKADIQDATHWLCLGHTVMLNDSIYKDQMGESFYPDHVLKAVREFDRSFLKLKQVLVDFRETEKKDNRSARDESDGVAKTRKALAKVSRHYNKT